MILSIDWENPILEAGAILNIKPTDLNGFYAGASDFDKTNLFFMLLTSFHHYLQQGEREKAAHLSFLMAYYLFVPLTPPGSQPLSLHYIKQAIGLNPLEEYLEWLPLIERGN